MKGYLILVTKTWWGGGYKGVVEKQVISNTRKSHRTKYLSKQYACCSLFTTREQVINKLAWLKNKKDTGFFYNVSYEIVEEEIDETNKTFKW